MAAVDSPHEATASEDPVGSQPIAGKPKRFWLLLLAALAALAVVAVAVAVLVLVRGSDTRTPQYSLEQMANAARNKDWDGVQKYIDVDAVTSTFVDAVLSSAFGADTSGTVGAGSTMKPKAVQQIKDSLKRRVVDTSGVETGDLSGVLYVDKPKTVTTVSEDEVLVTVEVPVSAGGTRDVRLRMKWAGDHWRIVAFDNATELLDLAF